MSQPVKPLQPQEPRCGIESRADLTGRPPSRLQAQFFLLLFALAALLLGGILWPFWQFLLLALLLSGIFRPVHHRLNRHLPSWAAALLTCTLITLIVFLPITLCISAFSAEAMNLLRLGKDTQILLKMQQALQDNILTPQVQAVLKEFGVNFDPMDVPAVISGLSKTAGMFIYNQASAWAANIVNFILQFCLLVMVSFFLLIDIEPLINFLARLSPLPENQSRLLTKKFMEIGGEILVDNGLYGLIHGVAGGFFVAALGLKAPVLYGVAMGVLAFLPLFGIGLVLLPTAIVLLLNGFISQALAIPIYYMIITLTMEYLVKPWFFPQQMQMHKLLLLLAIIGGISLFGILGIIYGPLIVTAFLTLAQMYLHEYLANPDPPLRGLDGPPFHD